MNFYGVGVRFSGTSENSILKSCLKNDCWYMGFSQGEKSRYDKLIEQAKCGDIVFAKNYHQNRTDFQVEAIGIITGKSLPMDIAKDYPMGFSVIWFKVLENPVCFTSDEVKLGGRKPDTIYHEKDTEMISKIMEMMKYDYERVDES